MKKILKSASSMIVIFALCCSILISVSAEPSSKGQNLLPQGSFDNEWDITRFYPVGVTPKWSTDGANSTVGSMMGENYGGSSCVKWETQVLPGETYDISFYAKCTGIATTIWMLAAFRGTNGQFETIMTETPIGTTWKKYELTWTVPTKAKNGQNIPGQVEISVRTNNDPKDSETVWFDEIKVISHGNIPADYLDVTGERGEWEDELPVKKEISVVSFSDVEDHWAEGVLKALASNGYISGYDNGTFCPDVSITRADFIKFIMSSFDSSDVSYNGVYSDVYKTDYYASDVQLAYQLGIIAPEMTVGNKFLPRQQITKQEAVSVLSAASKGLITESEAGNFISGGNVTRAETAAMVMRMLELDTRVAVFVDGVDGDDTNDGTSSRPVATIDKARQIVRNEKKNMKHNIFVLIKEGEYYLDNSLEFSQEDSGENGYNVVYTSYGTEKPVIMMGEHFSGFRKYDSSKNIYRVDIGGIDARQVYINGVRGIRARSEGYHGLTNVTNEKEYGHTTTDTFLADYKYPNELEMIYMVEWAQHYGKVDKIEVEGNIAKVIINPEWWDYATNDGDTSVGVTDVGVPLWYENAYELLDNPGEFYINTHDGYLYYIPRPYENPETMVATVPVGERLLTLNGTVDEKIHNLVFDNLQFSYTTWMKPTEKGHIEKQNVERTIDGDLIMIPSAVLTLNARYVDFLNCEFSKLGASALSLYGATQDCNVIGNEVYDVSAVGIALGSVTNTEEYKDNYYMTNTNPVQYKYFTVNNSVTNNYIHDIALDYGSSAGISAAYPKRTVFAHNEMGNMIYSGFHMGWNWSGNLYTGTGIYDMDITDNYIYDTMNDRLQDGAAIYMLGTTGGTMENPNEVSGNYVQRVRGYGAYTYTDDAASFYRFTRNVLEHDHIDERYTQNGTLGRLEGFKFYRWNHKGLVATDNYLNGQGERIYIPYDIHNTSTYAGEVHMYQNANVKHEETGKYFGVNSIYGNHNLEPGTPWPDDAQDIIDNSGLEESYHHLFDEDDIIRSIRTEKETELGVGKQKKLDITLYGRKTTLDSSYLPENTYYVSSRPDIVEVDADGNIKGKSSGRAEIWTYVPVGDRVLRGRTEVLCVTAGFYMDFESTYDNGICAGNFDLQKGDGAGDSEHFAEVTLDSDGIISVYSNMVKKGGEYRLSYKTKSDSEYDAKIRLFFNNPKYTVTEAIEGSGYAVGDVYNGQNFSKEFDITIPNSSDWIENTTNFTADGENFSITIDDLGTKAELCGYKNLGINFYRNEADATFCLDDVCLESVVSEYVPADLSYDSGTEMMGPRRTITVSGNVAYSAGTIGADNAYDVYIDGKKQTKLGGHFISTTDAADDNVLLGYSAADTATFAFIGGDETYGQMNIKPYVKYRFVVRAKAPAYVVDNTVRSEDAVYVDGKTGEVKVNNSSVTNGMIGAELSFGWSHISSDASRVNHTFTGYLDDNGRYIPFDSPDAELKSAVLTSDWVYYVGYFTNTNTLGIPRNYVDAKSTSEGVWYIDNMSIKEAKNEFPDGDFESQSLYVPVADANDDVEFVTTAGNTDLKWVQGAKNKTFTSYVNLTPSATYKLKIRAKVDDKEASGAKMHIKTTYGGRFVTFTPSSGTELTDEYIEYEYVVKLGDYAYNRLLIDVDTTTLDPTPESHSVWFDYIRLEKMDTISVEDIALNGALEIGKIANFTWRTSSISKCAIVKVYQTDGIDEGMLGAYVVTSDEISIAVPDSAIGKKIKLQVIALDEEQNPVSYNTYVSSETVSGIVVKDAQKGEMDFTAIIEKSNMYTGFVIFATYSENGKMLKCQTFDINSTLTPVSTAIGDATYAKIIVFDGTDFADTNMIPLCNCAEIR